MTIEEMSLKSERDLIFYVNKNDFDNVAKLIDDGIDINTPSMPSNPLYQAVVNGHKKIIRYLLKQKNIDSNLFEEEYGFRPIHGAVLYLNRTNDSEVLKLLLESNKVDINSTCKDNLLRGFTALHLAAYYEVTVAIELLLRYKADYSIKTSSGLSILDVAGEGTGVKNGSFDIKKKVKNLIKAFAIVEV